MRLDAHVHFWSKDALPANPGVRRIAALHADFLPSDYRVLSDADGVVLVQAAWDAEETLWCLGLADREPLIKAVIGWSPLEPAALEKNLDALCSRPAFRGLRIALNTGPTDAALLAEALRALAMRGLVAELFLEAEQLARAAELAAEMPGLSLVLNHGGGPRIAAGALEAWAGPLREAASLPNVSVKLSGLLERAGLAWTGRRIRPYIETLLHAFGPRRLLYASNWPMVTLAGSVADWRTLAGKALAELGADAADRTQIFGLAAARIYRIA